VSSVRSPPDCAAVQRLGDGAGNGAAVLLGLFRGNGVDTVSGAWDAC